LEYDSHLNLELHHAIDFAAPEKFTFRGNVSITSLNTGAVSIMQDTLTNAQRNQLKQLAEKNKLYRLRIVAITPTGEKMSYMTSTRACPLIRSQLTDVLWVSLDHVGNVLGVSQSVSKGGNFDCNDLKNYDAESELEEFNTDIYIKHIEMAPIPDTASFIQKMERERDARERGETKDNRSFFAKYWMYMVPVLILVLISGATNPEARA
jgi:ER membrane protein complex subunit 10